MADDKLYNEVLMYSGKILKKKGTRKDKEDKEVSWDLWKLSFESGRQYPWTCSSFGTLSDKGVNVADMKEGEFYEVCYKNTEYTHPEHGLVKTKQAVLIKKSSEDKCTKDNIGGSSQQSSTPEPSKKVVPNEWVNFANEYNEAMTENGNAMHMLGAYVANKHREMFADIVALCKKHFE